MSTTESALVFIAINSFFWTLSLVNLQMDLREIRRTYEAAKQHGR